MYLFHDFAKILHTCTCPTTLQTCVRLMIVTFFMQQWKRKAKRLATHGAPKNNAGAESLKYLGSKAIASLKRNNLPIPATSGKQPAKSVTSAPPVFKVSGTYFQVK